MYSMQVNIYEAKTQLSRLIKKALEGEEVIIARAKTPLVKIVRIEPEAKARQNGLHTGKVWLSSDFDEPLADFKDYV